MIDSVAEFYYLLRNGHLTFFWKWEENQNKFFQLHTLKWRQRLSSLASCDTTHLNSEFFGH